MPDTMNTASEGKKKVVFNCDTDLRTRLFERADRLQQPAALLLNSLVLLGDSKTDDEFWEMIRAYTARQKDS